MVVTSTKKLLFKKTNFKKKLARSFCLFLVFQACSKISQASSCKPNCVEPSAKTFINGVNLSSLFKDKRAFSPFTKWYIVAYRANYEAKLINKINILFNEVVVYHFWFLIRIKKMVNIKKGVESKFKYIYILILLH